MLFDHKFNERLLSFARNIAAITFITGLAIVILFRADTKSNIDQFDYILLSIVGWIVLLWSLYLVLANIHVLYHDFKIYLTSLIEVLSKDTTLKFKTLNSKQKNSTMKMTFYLIKISKLNALTFSLRYISICLIGFSFIIIWFMGAIEISERISSSFGFIEHK